MVAVGKICFYVFMFLCLYTTGGGGLYIRYLYMSKKHIIGLNRVKKTYFYVKMTYVFMFLCFRECSNDICFYVFMFLGMLQ